MTKTANEEAEASVLVGEMRTLVDQSYQFEFILPSGSATEKAKITTQRAKAAELGESSSVEGE